GGTARLSRLLLKVERAPGSDAAVARHARCERSARVSTSDAVQMSAENSPDSRPAVASADIRDSDRRVSPGGASKAQTATGARAAARHAEGVMPVARRNA